jgi:hypothetical protein
LLGRSSYTQEEFDQAKAAIARQLTAYKKLVKTVEESSDPGAKKALEVFEPLFFNHMTLALDRYFVHRVRNVTGKDGNPLNEVELLTESLINNDGVLRDNNVLKLAPGQSTSKLNVGDKIKLSAAQFERLSKAFLADLHRKFL